jgi:hypothetical protein
MPVHAGEVAPAAIAAELDQAGAELDPERQPAEQQEGRPRRRDLAVPEEDREEAGLQEERLPAERVEGLADVRDRLVEDPEQEPGRPS